MGVAYTDIGGGEVGAGLGISARIWRPPTDVATVGGLVDLHGGMWSNGDRTTDSALDSRLAAVGFTVVALDVPPAGTASCADIVEALIRGCAWARDLASGLVGGCPVGLLGCSSGGHLALLIGMEPVRGPGAHPYAFLVGCWPVVDPSARRRHAASVGRADIVAATDVFFGTGGDIERYNPQAALARGDELVLPPLMLIVAGHDANIPGELLDRFAATYRQCGGEVVVRRFPRAKHSFGVDAPGSVAAGRLVQDVVAFARAQRT